MNIDNQIVLALNSLAGHSLWLDRLMIFFAEDIVYVIIAGLVLYWFLAKDKWHARLALVQAGASFVLSRLVFTPVIRLIVPRDRPFLHLELVQLISKDHEASFPSGHAVAMFAVATSLYFYNKKLGAWLFAIAILMSLARVTAGVHYLSDVAAGAILGVVSAWLVYKFLARAIESMLQHLSFTK